MSKSSYLGANVDIQTDTFSGWINKTNQVRHDLGTVVVTTGSVAQPNSTNGAETSGNAHIEGTFSANTFAVASELRGGTVSVPAPLNVTTNVVFSDSETIQIDANTETFSVDANNSVISSNVTLDGAGKTFTINNAGTTVNGGDVTINTDTTMSANVDLTGTTLTATANATFTSTTHVVNATTTTVGANNTAFTLNVNADANFANVTIGDLLTVNADGVFNGTTTTFNNNVIIGSDNTDNFTLNAKLATNIIPDTATIDLGSDAEPFAELHVDDVYANADVEALGEFRIRRGSDGTIRHKSTTTGYQNINVILETSTASTKTPLNIFANSTVEGIRGSANTTQDLGDVGLWWKRAYVANVESTNVNTVNVDATGDITVGANLDVTGTSSLDDVTIATTLDVTGVATFTDTVNMNGNVNLGSDDADNVVFNGDVNSNIIPNANNTTNLGSATKRWNDLFVQDVTVSANVTIGNGLDVDGVTDLDTVNVSETLTVTGTSTHNGHVVLGSASDDNVSINGRVNTDIIPDASTYDLGSLALPWAEVHASSAFIYGNAVVDGELELDGSGTRTVKTSSANSTFNALTFELENSLASSVFPLRLEETSVIPGTDLAFDLGSAIRRWDVLHTSNVVVYDTITTSGAPGHTDINTGGDIVVEGDLYVQGTTTLSSNASLSLSESDITDLDVIGTLSMVGSARVDTDFIPSADSTHDMGTGAVRWANVYADTLHGAVAWANITSKPDPVVTVNLSGDVAGSGNATLTDLANGTISVTTTVQPNSVTLGTDTTGNYVASVAAGAGIDISGTGEGAAVTVTHEDTSTVTDLAVNNSGGTVLQDFTLTFDTFGHVTGRTAVSTNLDTRYARDAFKTINTDGQSVVADALGDSLSMTGGSGVTVTGTAASDAIVIASTDTLDSVTDRGATTTNAITVGGLTVNGDLNITGEINRTSVEEVHIADNYIVLNSDFTGDADTAGVDAGITIERGSDSNRSLRWNETTDRWQFQHSNGTYYNLPISSEYNNYAWTLWTDGVNRGSIDSGEVVNIVGGTDVNVAYSATNNTVTLNHADTSSLSGAYGQTGTADGTYIKSVTVDGRGHVTAVTTDDFDTRYLGVSGKAADSQLLDGIDSTGFIRANANDTVTANTTWNDNKRIQIGNSADMEIYHNATNNIVNLKVGDLQFRNNGVEIATLSRTTGNLSIDGTYSGNGSGLTNLNGSNITSGTVADARIAATIVRTSRTVSAGGGLTGGGDLSANRTISHADTSSQSSVNNSGTTVIQDVTLDTYGHVTGLNSLTLTATSLGGISSISNSTVTANTEWQDNKQAQFGNGSDLRIYHNGTNSHIDNNTGNLYIRVKGTENALAAVPDGAVTLYYNGVSKINTADLGVDITGRLVASGDILSTSDRRVKENIVTVTGALSKVERMRGVEFNRIGETETQVGVIAQEVEEVVPEAVQTMENGIKTVAYGNMVGVLIEAIKELKAEIEELKSR